jgi:hypothetical protein
MPATCWWQASDKRSLSCVVGSAPPGADPTVCRRCAQQIFGNARHRRGETGIVGTSSDERFLVDKRLIFPVEIEPRFAA